MILFNKVRFFSNCTSINNLIFVPYNFECSKYKWFFNIKIIAYVSLCIVLLQFFKLCVVLFNNTYNYL